MEPSLNIEPAPRSLSTKLIMSGFCLLFALLGFALCYYGIKQKAVVHTVNFVPAYKPGDPCFDQLMNAPSGTCPHPDQRLQLSDAGISCLCDHPIIVPVAPSAP